MDEYRSALDEFARQKAPQEHELARLQQAVRLKGIARAKGRGPSWFAWFAWSGWGVAGVSVMALLAERSKAPEGRIDLDPSLTEHRPAVSAPQQPALPRLEPAPAEAPPACTPQVKSIAPSKVTVGEPVTFTVTGSCLPAGAVAVVPDCSGLTYTTRSEGLLGFACIPTATGKRSGSLRSGPEGPRVFSFVFDAQPRAPSPQAPAEPVAQPPAPPPAPSANAAEPLPSQPPRPPLALSAEQALSGAKGHVFRIDGVLSATREALSQARSRREKQCLDAKVFQLHGAQAAALEAQSSLIDALRRGDDAQAQAQIDRVAQSRALADRIYAEAQGCILIGD